MSISIAVQGSEVIGAMTPPRSSSPFNRAHLVACSDGGEIVQVRAYTSNGHVQGPALRDDEWEGLVAAEQALALPRAPKLSSGAALWVLRPGLPHRDRALKDLRASSVLLQEHIAGPGDSWLCLVDESRDAASELRDRWRGEAAARVLSYARAGDWTTAEEHAEVAHAISRSLDPENLALLHLAYEHTGRETRARGILGMAKRSRGDDFVTHVITRLAQLRASLTTTPSLTAPPYQATRPRNARAWRKYADQGNKRALGRLKEVA